jgi:hypothetical protein
MTFNDEDNSSSGTCLEIDKANVLPDNGALVTSDARHPSGWNISVRGLAVPLVPKGGQLEALIEECRALLTDEQLADPSYGLNYQLWLALFQKERRPLCSAIPYRPLCSATTIRSGAAGGTGAHSTRC